MNTLYNGDVLVKKLLVTQYSEGIYGENKENRSQFNNSSPW